MDSFRYKRRYTKPPRQEPKIKSRKQVEKEGACLYSDILKGFNNLTSRLNKPSYVYFFPWNDVKL